MIILGTVKSIIVFILLTGPKTQFENTNSEFYNQSDFFYEKSVKKKCELSVGSPE